MMPLMKSEHDELERRYGAWMKGNEVSGGPAASEKVHAEYILRSLGYSVEAARLAANDLACHVAFFMYTRQRGGLGSYADEIEAGDGRQYGTRIAELERECKSLRAAVESLCVATRSNADGVRHALMRTGR